MNGDDSSSAPIATHTRKPIWAPGSRYPDGSFDDDAQLIFVRPDWHRHAMCRATMRDGHCDWFPKEGGYSGSQAHERARALCRVCPVRAECAAAGVHQYGVWGGTLTRGDESASRAS